jgi:CheY-like chemotaxis protein
LETTPRRVLVIDDNAYAADTLGLILGHWGHEVRVAYDGASGIAAFADFRPEVVFLDIEMPTMNGFEVARALRARPDFDGVVLVALSGHDVREGASLFNHYVCKPLNFNVLERLLVKGATPGIRSVAPHSV